MAVMTNGFQLDVLKKILQAVDPAWDSATTLYLSLHTSSPGAAGSQTTNEVGTGAYAGYARVAVARDATGWTISSQTIVNDDPLSFPACSGGTGATITHIGIGTSSSGAGTLLIYAALTASLSVSTGITPSFAAGALVVAIS